MSGSNHNWGHLPVTGPGTDADEERLARACVARHARDAEDARSRGRLATRVKTAAVLTEAKVQKMRARHAAGENRHELAAAFGVHHRTVWAAVTRRTWKWVE